MWDKPRIAFYAKNELDLFNCFDTIPTFDGHTDRQTDCHRS